MKSVKYSILLLSIFVFASCGDWIDVQPKSQITADNMFKKSAGYKDALMGIYINMSDEKLYGGYMSLTRTEFLAQTLRQGYAPASGNFEYIEELYSYRINLPERKASTETLFEDIWTAAYNTIANTNYFISRLEAEEAAMFEEGAREQMLGEAYAIRAYIHFDMLRLFGLPYLSPEGKSSKRVPYVDKYVLELTPSSTADEIMDKAMADLTKAENLLKDSDPAITGNKYYDYYFNQNRSVRMNYFAVRALKARIALYRQDWDTAYDQAKYVIDNATKLGARFITDNDMAAKDPDGNGYNRSSQVENIFGVSNQMLIFYVTPNFEQGALTSVRIMSRPDIFTAFYTNVSDMRRKYWIKQVSTTYRFIKYATSLTFSELEKYPDPRVSMIRLGELYLIAVEAAANSTTHGGLTEANRLYNIFRNERGITPFAGTNLTELNAELETEYFRELLGEGQLFYYYKRINKPILKPIVTGGLYPSEQQMTPEKYTPDLPQTEITAGRTY